MAAVLAPCAASASSFPPGSKVEYFSQNNGGWMPALVLEFDPAAFTYKLDIHPAAQPAKLRWPLSAAAPPPAQPIAAAAALDVPEVSTRHRDGAAVEYYSASQGGWVPAVVRSFNMRTGTYVLDVHPEAPPAKVRAREGGQPGVPHGAVAAAPLAQPGKCAELPKVGPPPQQQLQQLQQQQQQQQQQHCLHPLGSAVEYFSASQGGWIPAVVQGFDPRAGKYNLDVQPCAEPSKVRFVVPPGGPPAEQRVAACPPLEPGMRTCGLCHANFSADSLHGADCEHRFCVPCLRLYVQNLDFIREHVRCPSCPATVTASQVQTLVGKEQYKARQDEVARQDAELASKLAQGGSIVCPKCGKEHEGISCAQYSDWERKNRDADRSFEELVGRLQLRCCPVCGAPSERGEGCNFMQCRSDKCQKYTYWCYICGRQMRLEDHYSHYPRGPYVDECYTPVNERLPLAAPGAVVATPELVPAPVPQQVAVGGGGAADALAPRRMYPPAGGYPVAAGTPGLGGGVGAAGPSPHHPAVAALRPAEVAEGDDGNCTVQ